MNAPLFILIGLALSGAVVSAAEEAQVTPTPEVSPPSEPIAEASPTETEKLLPRIEIIPLKRDGLQVGDVIDVQLRGAALPEGAKLRPVLRFSDGFSVSESGKIGVLKPGSVQLPALEIVDASGAVVAETDPLALNVASAMNEQQAPAGVPPAPGAQPGQQPEPEPPLGPTTLGLPVSLQATVGLVLFGLLTVGAYYLIRWAQKRFFKRAPAVQVPLSADTIALRRLAQVETEKWYEKGNHKRHFFEISEALKAYFSDRYSIDARESTTTELFDRLADLRERRMLDSEEFKHIRDCFSVLDLVKFTDYKPEPTESVAQLEEARRIVVRTKEPPRVRSES